MKEQNFIGQKLEDVEFELKLENIPYRITMRDNIPMIVTGALQVDRYNFEVVNNIITHQYFG